MTTGRAAPHPTYTAESGYTIAYRLLSPETMPRLQAAAIEAHPRPPVPTQRVETAPDVWVDVENPHADGYAEALAAWQQRIEQDVTVRMLTLMESYVLIYEVDQHAVDQLRAAMAAVGAPLDDLSDAQVYLWRIVATTPDDLRTLIGRLFGRSLEEAIQAQKATFRGDVPRAAA